MGLEQKDLAGLSPRTLALINAADHQGHSYVWIILSVLSTLGCVALGCAAYLMNDTNTQLRRKLAEQPQEIVREVPVTREVIKTVEVPRDVVRTVQVPKEIVNTIEVPAPLSPRQRFAIDTFGKLSTAQFVSNQDALFQINSVRVLVSVDQRARDKVDEDKCRNKFELILRRQNIVIDDKSPILVLVTVSIKPPIRAGEVNIYSMHSGVYDNAVIIREGVVKRASACLWQTGCHGYAGDQVFEHTIMDAVETYGEATANALLAARDRFKEQ